MHALAITRKDYGNHLDLLAGMHRLRYRVFKERLGWNVSVTGDKEIDAYDGLGPTYLLIVTPSRRVVGSARLLPTTGPNMLADTFPELLAGEPAPCAIDLIESSRFCVDTEASDELGPGGLNKVTCMLIAAGIEWGLISKASGIVTVTDLRMERILRRVGLPFSRIGGPLEIGVTTAVAGMAEVSETIANRVRSAGGLDGPVLLQNTLLAA